MVQTGSGGKTAQRCVLGVALSLTIYMALQLLTAWLLVRGGVGEGRLGTCVWVCALIAGFAGSCFACRGSAQPMLSAGACLLIFWAVIQLLGFLAADSYVPQRALQQLLPLVISALCAMLVCGGRGSKRRSPRAKSARRRRRHS